MEMMHIKNEKFERAKNRVKTLKDFRIHVFVFVMVNTFLALLNYKTTGWQYMWFLYPTMAWSLGLVIHTIVTFDLNPFFGRNWENRKIKELMEKEDEQQKWK